MMDGRAGGRQKSVSVSRLCDITHASQCPSERDNIPPVLLATSPPSALPYVPTLRASGWIGALGPSGFGCGGASCACGRAANSGGSLRGITGTDGPPLVQAASAGASPAAAAASMPATRRLQNRRSRSAASAEGMRCSRRAICFIAVTGM